MIMMFNNACPYKKHQSNKAPTREQETHWVTRDPLGHSFNGFFPPLVCFCVMGHGNGLVLSQFQTAVSWRKTFAYNLKYTSLRASELSETVTKNMPRPSSHGEGERENGVGGMSKQEKVQWGLVLHAPALSLSQHFGLPTREGTGPGVASEHPSILKNRKRMGIQGP